MRAIASCSITFGTFLFRSLAASKASCHRGCATPRWVELTQRLAVNIEGEDYRKKITSGNGNSVNNSNQGKAKDPDAMDLDALKVARLNDEEREEWLQ